MTKSMTGFANATGAVNGFTWGWEIRAVNARGMDIRLRLPDWIDGLEAALRPAIQNVVARGNVNLTLKVTRDDVAQVVEIDANALGSVLAAIKQIEETAARDHDLQLAATSAAEILSMRALGDARQPDRDTAPLLLALKENIPDLLAQLDAMRQNEGLALNKVLSGQLVQIEALTRSAGTVAKARRDTTAKNLRKNLARVLDNSDGADADRVAQELAILTLKTDVTEEIDRLYAHISAARDLLKYTGPVGRKFDFLTQEFNREVNTLCSKAQASELTGIGLDLKAVVEQMREQVQNVE